MHPDSSRIAGRLLLTSSGLVVGYLIIKKVNSIYKALKYTVDIDDGPGSESRRCIPPSDFDYQAAAMQNNAMHGAATSPLITKDKALSEAQEEGSLVYLRYSNCDLYMLGSAHVSKKSAELAYRITRAARPESLVVELCIDRQQLLWREPKHKQEPMIDDPSTYQLGQDEGRGDGEEENDDKKEEEEDEGGKGKGAVSALSSIARSLRGGHNALHSVLNSAYEEVEAQLNTTMGLEFIRARQALIDNLTCPAVDLSSQSLSTPDGLSSQDNGSSGQGESDKPGSSLADPLLIEERLHRRTRFLYQTKSIRSRPSLLAYKKERGEGMARAYPYIELERAWPATNDQLERRLWPLEHARIIYGDVQVGMTVRRCWGALNPWEKVTLVWNLLIGCLTQKVDEGLLDSIMKEDMLKMIEKEVGGTYPRLLFPLLHERNVHLANALKAATSYRAVKEHDNPVTNTSVMSHLLPASSVTDVSLAMEEVLAEGKGKGRVVVAIVGKGHLPGLVYALVKA